MSQARLVEQIAELLAETGHAHHQAFIEIDGEDPEWPIWYAGYLEKRLPELLDAELTKAEIIYLLLGAEKARTLSAPGANWPRFYGHWLAKRYSGV